MSFDNFNSSGFSSYHTGGPPTGMSGSTYQEFTRLSQVVGSNVQKITQNVATVQRLANQLGTPQDCEELRDKLHQVQHYTNQLAKDTNKYLKDIAQLPQPVSQSDQRQRKMQKERLMNEFTSSLNNFQAAQRVVADKEKASYARARAHSKTTTGGFISESKSDEQLMDFSSYGSSQSPQQQVLQVEEDVDMELLREREQAIHQLESDIMDVNQIFKDLGMLVHEQGEMIDSIEANVESAQVHVEQGTTQLQKASEYQSKARRKKCICIIILVVVVVVIGLIIGLSVGIKK